MGGKAEAKTETNIVNEAVTNVIMSSAQNCSANNANTQELYFRDIKVKGCSVDFSNISQDMKVTQNFSCAQDSSQNVELLNKFKSELDAKTEASLKGITTSSTKAETITNIKNKIETNINMSSVANCVANNINQQKMEFGKIDVECAKGDRVSFNNIGQKLVATQVAKCIQSNKQVSDLSNELDNEVKAATSSKNEGLTLGGSFESLASLGASLIPLLIGAAIILVFSSLLMMMK